MSKADDILLDDFRTMPDGSVYITRVSYAVNGPSVHAVE